MNTHKMHLFMYIFLKAEKQYEKLQTKLPTENTALVLYNSGAI